ncbi:MAG: AMP-binding protein, partial [Sulfurovum sp.]|uniref:AMP-binding protein n=1 Tax=Sulfurovum sp. TaxID=1969726 RepID=UPI002867BDD8
MLYPYQNFYEMIHTNAMNKPNKTVVFIENEKISNLYLLQKIDSFCRFLSHEGIGQGDKLGLILPNSLEFLIAFCATSKIGAVVVPVNNMLKEEEYTYILNDAEVKILLTSKKFAAQTQNLQSTTTVQKTVWIDEIPLVEGEHFLFSEAMSIPPFHDEVRVSTT